MTKDPLVSISIPTYNSAAFLERCLLAVKAQTYPNIEINIVDGYSKDGTVEIAKRFDAQVVQDKLGLLNARKIGADLAKGEYVLLLDSDQILEPNAIQSAIALVQGRELDMLVLEEDVYRNKTFLEHLFHLDRKLIHAVKDFSPFTGVMLPRFYRRQLLTSALSNIPEAALRAGGQDHAIIYYEAWQLSQKVDLVPNAVRHMEPSTLREIVPKFYRWGYTSDGARNIRYKQMLEKKERFRKGLFRRGLVGASIASILLLLVKGIPYMIGRLVSNMDHTLTHNRRRQGNSRVLLLSRPFENSFTGTGEQVTAREVFEVLRKDQKLTVSYIKTVLVKPYKHVASILFYDYFIGLIMAISHLVKPYRIVIICSPFQSAYTPIFNMRGGRTICIVHDLFFDSATEKNLFDRYASICYGWTMKNTSSLMTTTAETERKIYTKYGRHSFISPLGVTDHMPAAKLSSKKFTKTVGYIGSYAARKRPEFLLRAISSNENGISFRLAGITPDIFIAQVKALGERSKSAKFLGELSDQEKQHFFDSIAFLYFPTELEGFGLPLVEAMRFGAIPIVHKDAKIPQIIKKQCEQIENPTELSRIMEKYNNQSSFVERLRDNHAYSTQFNWVAFTNNLVNECIGSST